MRKVNFLVAGSQKAGTSALDAYLRLHPKIQMANKKEIHFFDDDEICNDYDYYHRHFVIDNNKKIYGESTPIYLYWIPSIKRIAKYNSKMKFIILLRNPIERAFSHWAMEFSKEKEKRSFTESIHDEFEKSKNFPKVQHRVFSYIERGFYSEQIKRLWTFFPKNQTLIIKYEDYKLNQQFTLDSITDFLEIEKYDGIKCHSIFKTNYQSTISLQDKNFLKSIFHHEIKEVESILDWNCDSWINF